MKKIFFLLLLLINIVLVAQSTDLKNGLGFSAGMDSGMGISYKHIVNKTAYKFTFGILAFNGSYNCYTETEKPLVIDSTAVIDTTSTCIDSCEGDHFSGNFGIQYFYYLHKAKKSSFYLSLATAIYYSSQKYQNQKYKYMQIDSEHYQTVSVSDKYYTTENEITLNSGIGIGIDYNITKNIVFSFGLPITFSFSDNDFRIFMYVPHTALMYFF